MSDPQLSIHCPTCDTPLVYIRAEKAVYIYRCPVHRLFVLQPDGLIRPERSATRPERSPR